MSEAAETLVTTPPLKLVANNYNGEQVVRLYYKDYVMKINMDVISKFQSATGKDFMHCAIKAMNALRKCPNLSPLDQAEVMTEAVAMDDAAHLFYIAAKVCDKTVTFEEIQEAVLMEGPMTRLRMDFDAEKEHEDNMIPSYPVKFANLMMFATLGVVDEAKK